MSLYLKGQLQEYENQYREGGEKGAKFRATVIAVAHEAGSKAIKSVAKFTGENSLLEYFILEKMIAMLKTHQEAMKDVLL